MEISQEQAIKNLTVIPGVGKQTAKDLLALGIKEVQELRNRSPEKLYEELCLLQGNRVDRCMLYVFRCAVYYASETHPEYDLLKWWKWKDAK